MASFGDLNRVRTNVQSFDAQLSLNRINKDLSSNKMRLSTGLKINKAEDNAAGYSIATKLKSRITGLEQVLSNIGDSKSVLDIAESGFNQIIDSLIEMKSLAIHGSNQTLGPKERGYIAEQIAQLGEEMNEIADQTIYQDLELLNGFDAKFGGELTLTFQVGERAADVMSTSIKAVNINELFKDSPAANGIGNSSFFGSSIGGGTGPLPVQVDIISLLDSYGNVVDDTGMINIDTRDINNNSMGDIAAAITGQFTDEGITAEVNDTSNGIVIKNRSNEQFQIRFSGEFGGRGTADTYSHTTQAASEQGSLSLSGFDISQYRSFIDDIDSAVNMMSDRITDIGIAQSSLSVREYTVSQAISANASAKSRIMDTDFAREQSESVRLQILQQTATSALSQANMGPQSVMGFLS